jgi:hypothetical protein
MLFFHFAALLSAMTMHPAGHALAQRLQPTQVSSFTWA